MSFDLPQIQLYWDNWQCTQSAQDSKYTDWADHPIIFREVMKNAFGDENTDFFQFLKKRYPECNQSHTLSLCCGDASFEMQLLRQGIFETITGLDISSSRLEAAKIKILSTPPPPPLTQWKLQFECLDVNQGLYGSSHYDVVFAKAALHHLIDLEKSFEGIVNCLKPGGLLIATNVHPSNDWKNWMEYLAEWHLVYRDEQQFLALAPSAASPDSIRVIPDATGVNIFLEVRKPDVPS